MITLAGESRSRVGSEPQDGGEHLNVKRRLGLVDSTEGPLHPGIRLFIVMARTRTPHLHFIASGDTRHISDYINEPDTQYCSRINALE